VLTPQALARTRVALVGGPEACDSDQPCAPVGTRGRLPGSSPGCHRGRASAAHADAQQLLCQGLLNRVGYRAMTRDGCELSCWSALETIYAAAW
jgi:hypothetical protein